MSPKSATDSFTREDWIQLILDTTEDPTRVLSVMGERQSEHPEVALLNRMTASPPEVIANKVIPAIQAVVAQSKPSHCPALRTALYLANFFEDTLTTDALLRIAFGAFPANNRGQAVSLLPLDDEALHDPVLERLRKTKDEEATMLFQKSASRRAPALAKRIDEILVPVVVPAPRQVDRNPRRATSFLSIRNAAGASANTVAFGPDDSPTPSETELTVTPNEDVLIATFSAKEYDKGDFPAGAVLVEAIDPVAEGERVVAHRLMPIQAIPDSDQPRQFLGNVDLLDWKESPDNQLPREFRGQYRASLLATSNQKRLKGIPHSEIQRYEKSISHNPTLLKDLRQLTDSLDSSRPH
jgi:hypothetical protein